MRDIRAHPSSWACDAAAARVLANREVIEAVVTRLEPTPLANWAAASKAFHDVAQIPLAMLHVGARVQPTAALDNATSLHINSNRILGHPDHACKSLCWLLPRLPDLKLLSLTLPDMSEPQVLAILRACRPVSQLTFLALEHTNLLSMSAGALADWLAHLPHLRHLSLAHALLTDHSAGPICMTTRGATLLTALDLTGNALSDNVLEDVVSGWSRAPHLRKLCFTRREGIDSPGRVLGEGQHEPALDLHGGMGQAVARGWCADSFKVTELTVEAGFLRGEILSLPLLTTLRALHLPLASWRRQHETFSLHGVLAGLADLPGLTALTLPTAVCKRGGAQMLASALMGLPRLQFLHMLDVPDLIFCPNMLEMPPLFTALAHLSVLTHLCLLHGLGRWPVEVATALTVALDRLRSLRSLELRITLCEHALALGRLEGLTHLVLLVSCERGEEGLLEGALEQLTSLQELDVRWYQHWRSSAAGLCHALAGGCLTSLRSGHYGGCTQLPEEDMLPVARAPVTLRRLEVNFDCEFFDELHTSGALRLLTNLTTLRLNRAAGSDNTSAIIRTGAALARMEQLRDLAVHDDGNYTPAPIVQALQSLTQLTHLQLCLGRLDERARKESEALTRALKGMRDLRVLRVSLVHVGTAAPVLRGVAGLSALTSLSLKHLSAPAHVFDSTMAQVRGLKRLSLYGVHVDHCRRRQSTLEWLSYLGGLTALELRMQFKFSPSEIACLTRVLPQLRGLQLLELGRDSTPWPEDADYYGFCECLLSMQSLVHVTLHSCAKKNVCSVQAFLDGRMPPWFSMTVQCR